MLLKPSLGQITFSKTGMTLVSRMNPGILPKRRITILCRCMSDTARKKTFQQLEGIPFTIL